MARQSASNPSAADFGPERWAWHSCERWDTPGIALTDAARFVRDLTEAFFSGDLAWFERAAAVQFADMVAAFDTIPPEDLRQPLAFVITQNSPQPVPSLPPPTPALFAEGRLLGLFAPDGGAYPRKGGEFGTSAGFLFGKLGGHWQIIR